VSRPRSQSPAAPPAAPASACEWCGAALPEAADRRAREIRCGECGSWSTSPPPGDDELERAYGHWYRPEGGRFAGLGDRLLRRLRGRLASRLDRIAPPGRVLDVGAGDAALVEALRGRGRDATGIDPFSADPAVLRQGIEETTGSYAAVVFWHSLEHLRSAGAALGRAASIVQPGGVIVIAMPNAASLQASAFGERWFALDPPRHLVHVPAAALIARLSALGLTVERISYLRGGQVVFGWLHGLVGTLPGQPDLYDAIRRPAARQGSQRLTTRAGALAAAVLLFPVALACATAEVAVRRGGTVYVEARHV
jgi:SAM-dependent methyltransferase